MINAWVRDSEYYFEYSKLDSSGSVNKFNEACIFETKVWRFWNQTALIVQQIIPPYYDNIQDFFKFGIPGLENPTACRNFDSCVSHLTVVGHLTNAYFLLSRVF